MRNLEKKRAAERGSAKTKFLLILVGLFLFGHAGLNYIPVAYEGENFKQEMQTAVVQGLATPSSAAKPTEIVKLKLQRAARDNNLPEDTFMDVKQKGKSLEARVYYLKSINILPFGIYTYDYEFDHTATPVGFLIKSFD
ncbi:MAG: hypothetical protein JWN60_2356 [Acidobacteria bacterium]|jgi:hypothetical protein|nr:hypothetical protein [Acidobacteriota bacterium]